MEFQNVKKQKENPKPLRDEDNKSQRNHEEIKGPWRNAFIILKENDDQSRILCQVRVK